MHWTGSQWCVGFSADVAIGVIAAGATVQISYTNPRFITPEANATNVIPIEATWARTNNPGEVPILLRCTLLDETTGEIFLTLHNQYAVPVDFETRGVYFEKQPAALVV